MPIVEKNEAAALWDWDSSWSGGQSDKKHNALDRAVDAVIALLART